MFREEEAGRLSDSRHAHVCACVRGEQEGGGEGEGVLTNHFDLKSTSSAIFPQPP